MGQAHGRDKSGPYGGTGHVYDAHRSGRVYAAHGRGPIYRARVSYAQTWASYPHFIFKEHQSGPYRFTRYY